MFVDEGKMVIPWNDLMLRLTKQDAVALNDGLQKLLKRKNLRRSSTQKHVVFWGGRSNKFTVDEASSLSAALVKHIALSNGEIVIEHTVGEYLSKEKLIEICQPMRLTGQFLGRVWTVLCEEAMSTPDFVIWCNICGTTKDQCDTQDSSHPSESNSRVFELSVASLTKYRVRIENSQHKIASTRIKKVIRTVIDSLENTLA